MSAPIPQPLPAYQFPARPRCTPRRTVHFITETFSRGLVGGGGFGGFLGIIVLMIFAVPIALAEDAGWWQLMVVTSYLGSVGLGYVGFRTMRSDRAERDGVIVGTILYALAGGIIGAPVLMPFAIVAFAAGLAVGILPGIVLWLIYGLALVLFTVRRYSPFMSVSAFRRDARRLAALTTWLAILAFGSLLYTLLGDPTSSRDVVTALALITALATLTAPFAWWHSKSLIDWWLSDIEKSGAG